MKTGTKQRWQRIGPVLLISLGALWGWLGLIAQNGPSISGIIQNSAGPLAGARVRVRATTNLTFSAADGTFTLEDLVDGEPVEVTAWAAGYYISSTLVTPTVAVGPGSWVTLTLRPYHTSDHPNYEWASPLSGAGACIECHPMIVAQWQENAHGRAIDNPRFYSMYTGSNISGTTTINPGYITDFPGTAGNCANCHAPGFGLDGYLTTNMVDARAVITAGIHCDFCHKLGAVYLNPTDNIVYANAPGVQSYQPLRPPPGDNIFFGPYDDIPDPDTYLPLITQSAYCAPCHQFSFWGTPIYESYSEWLQSPFAADGVTCQDCHMPPTGDSFFALPEKGGLSHPPQTIPSHLQLGASSTALLQESATMMVQTQQAGDRLRVTVTITNSGSGHHLPTDHPGRHLLLTVQAYDDEGAAIPFQDGPIIPAWGGPQAGLPGIGYAKLLQDVESGAFPVVSYWKQVRILSDNRLPAGGGNTSIYEFMAPEPGRQVTVTAVLRFRRLFQSEMDARGWQTPDVVMEQGESAWVVSPWWNLYLPQISGSFPQTEE